MLKVLHAHASNKIRLHPTLKIKQQPMELTPEKACLIGHFIGDGYISERDYAIVYANTCQKLVEKVSNAFTSVYGLRGHISLRKDKMLCVYWNSKEAWKDLRQYTDYYSKKWRIPTEIFENPKILGPPFLRALFDDEGCVILWWPPFAKRKGWLRRVYLKSFNNQGCEDVVRLLSLLGIHAHKVDKAVIISGRENIRRFRSVVGFTEGVKVGRGWWKGIDKTEVINLLLLSYDDHSIPHQKLAELTTFNAISSLSSFPAAQTTS